MSTHLLIEAEGLKIDRTFEPTGQLETVNTEHLGLQPAGVEILQIIASCGEKV